MWSTWNIGRIRGFCIDKFYSMEIIYKKTWYLKGRLLHYLKSISLFGLVIVQLLIVCLFLRVHSWLKISVKTELMPTTSKYLFAFNY